MRRLQEIIQKLTSPSNVFNLIIEPKRSTSIPWNVDINTATLDMLSELIRKKNPEYGDNTLKFTFNHESIPFSPETDNELRDLLSSLLKQNKMTVKISVQTPANHSVSGPWARYCSYMIFGTTYIYYRVGNGALSHISGRTHVIALPSAQRRLSLF